MKKLLAALVLTLGTAALAQSDANPNTRAQQENQRNDASRIETGVDATEVLPGLSGSQAHKQDKQRDKQQTDAALMNKAHAFNVNGTLKGSAMGGITLSRQNNLPDVDLDVRDQTKVMLDGKKVAVGDIPEGAQVRASFQIDGDDAVALEINATSPKGARKSPKSGTQGNPQGTQNTQPVPQQ
ncbi:hypothetical protein [Archangium sp.]|uniref:hypothetical protein n=1 Tax=Archangium sp. TaxID=1872627 RepID=UPI002D2A3131|nr:hypothetical protein [Archangium sp.]HYO59516.1 hypothetical protein [Archangium sp.]